VVIPHFATFRREPWQQLLAGAPEPVGAIGLDERTGILSRPDGRWLVAGEGRAYWHAPGTADPVIARDGELLELPPGTLDSAAQPGATADAE
jgi:hypothetical protein